MSVDPLPYRASKLSREASLPLSEAHAVILGGNSGIGMATARSMVERGARVIIVGRSVAKNTPGHPADKEAHTFVASRAEWP